MKDNKQTGNTGQNAKGNNQASGQRGAQGGSDNTQRQGKSGDNKGSDGGSNNQNRR